MTEQRRQAVRKLEITVIDDERMLLQEIERMLWQALPLQLLDVEIAIQTYETLAHCRLSKPEPEPEPEPDGVMRVAILDLFLRGSENGFAVLRDDRFRRRFDIVVVLSRMDDNLPVIRSLLTRGLCDAYIAKTMGSLPQLVTAVVRLAQGTKYRNEVMDIALASQAENPFDQLSSIEVEVLRLTHLENLHPKGIAARMGCEPKTVYSNRSRAYAKLGTSVDREVHLLLILNGQDRGRELA